MNKGVLFFCLAVGLSAHGEEKIRGKEQKVIRYPFGSVAYMPQPKKPAEEIVTKGKIHARTQGVFKVSYELARDKDGFVARRVNVRVVNKEEYLSPATPDLKNHEAVHRRINETQAALMEKELSAFRVAETRPDRAEKKFKDEFQKRIDAVKKLHADWDDTQVFIKPAPAADYK